MTRAFRAFGPRGYGPIAATPRLAALGFVAFHPDLESPEFTVCEYSVDRSYTVGERMRMMAGVPDGFACWQFCRVSEIDQLPG